MVMKSGRQRYEENFCDRTGKRRRYFRRNGKRYGELPLDRLSPEYHVAYARFLAASEPERAAVRAEHVEGSLGSTIKLYLASPDFKQKAARTQKEYRRLLEEIAERWGAKSFRGMGQAQIYTVRDAFGATPRKADMAVALVSIVCSWGRKRGLRDDNPALGIDKLYDAGDGYEPWTEDEVALFLREADALPVRVMVLALFTGQRRGDLSAMDWTQYDGTAIQVVQSKTGASLWIPCHRDLRAALDPIRKPSGRILVSSTGAAIKPDHLTNIIGRAARKLNIPKPLHGLRKACSVRLAEAGCSEEEIDSILGHATAAMSKKYRKRARQKLLARAAIDRLENAPGTPTAKLGPEQTAKPKIEVAK